MCEFPSWIELEDKSIVYLTDKDLENPCFKDNDDDDLVGHSAIRKMYTKVEGTNKEGFPCHPEIVQAIKDGKMKKLMKLGGLKEIHLNSDRELHRTDGPACEYTNGTKEWFVNGLRHRTDGPAIEYYHGSKLWYINGKKHREDGPAVEYADGTKEWFLNGLRHRTDGPAIEYIDGSNVWYLNGARHRTDGPACDYFNGAKLWHIKGKLHRTDGPAVEYTNEKKEWWLNGRRHRDEEEFNKAIK